MQLATILVMDKAILKDSQVLQEICPSLVKTPRKTKEKKKTLY